MQRPFPWARALGAVAAASVVWFPAALACGRYPRAGLLNRRLSRTRSGGCSRRTGDDLRQLDDLCPLCLCQHGSKPPGRCVSHRLHLRLLRGKYRGGKGHCTGQARCPAAPAGAGQAASRPFPEYTDTILTCSRFRQHPTAFAELLLSSCSTPVQVYKPSVHRCSSLYIFCG